MKKINAKFLKFLLEDSKIDLDGEEVVVNDDFFKNLSLELQENMSKDIVDIELDDYEVALVPEDGAIFVPEEPKINLAENFYARSCDKDYSNLFEYAHLFERKGAKRTGRVVTLAWVVFDHFSEKTIEFAYAVCNPDGDPSSKIRGDNFSRKIGRKIAGGRLAKGGDDSFVLDFQVGIRPIKTIVSYLGENGIDSCRRAAKQWLKEERDRNNKEISKISLDKKEEKKSENWTSDKIGNKLWKNEAGDLHRTDGPAFEGASGMKEWWLNGICHRTDGPAIEYPDGRKQWFIDGIECSEAEHKEKTKRASKPETFPEILDPFSWNFGDEEFNIEAQTVKDPAKTFKVVFND